MEAVGGIPGSAALRFRPARPEPTREPLDARAPADGRALVPIRRIEPNNGPRRRYPVAGFLAHLIASDQGVPQTRVRGRVAPGEAVAAYSARRKAVPHAGRILRQSA